MDVSISVSRICNETTKDGIPKKILNLLTQIAASLWIKTVGSAPRSGADRGPIVEFGPAGDFF